MMERSEADAERSDACQVGSAAAMRRNNIYYNCLDSEADFEIDCSSGGRIMDYWTIRSDDQIFMKSIFFIN